MKAGSLRRPDTYTAKRAASSGPLGLFCMMESIKNSAFFLMTAKGSILALPAGVGMGLGPLKVPVGLSIRGWTILKYW